MCLTTNITRFVNWLEAEKASGLIDLKGTCVGGDGFVTKLINSNLITREKLCSEFMRMIEALNIPNARID